MNHYIPNRLCPCPRCRARGLMGAAVLITLGVLFLLDEYSGIRFHQSVPALLIVIGVVLYLGRSASTEGHVPSFRPGGATAAPPPMAGNPPGPEVNR